MSSNKLNVNDITRGAMAVIISQVQPKQEEGLTVAQAAQMLGMSVQHLNQMRQINTGPQAYREGNKIFYKPSSIRAYIQANTKKSRAA
jgi:hypothetical protein